MEIVRKSVHGKEARDRLLNGVNTVADAVKVTMGAKGRTVFTSQGFITKDGATVARDIEINDDDASAHGAKLIKEASIKTCDKAGDGTTTVCVLAQAMIKEGFKLIEEGKDPQSIKADMEKTKPIVINALKEISKEVTDITEIAKVSANNEEIGQVVADAVHTVGANGLVTVEKTYDSGYSVEFADGYQLDKGLMAGAFLTDGQRRRAEYKDARVLLFKGAIHDLQGFAKVVSPLVEAGEPLVIIADSYDDSVARSLHLTALKGGKFIPLTSNFLFHDETFDDLAVFTGAVVMTEADGFKNFNMENLGFVKNIVSTPTKTTIQPMGEFSDKIKEQVNKVLNEAKQFNDSKKSEVEKRASRLLGKIAIIKMPQTTETNDRELEYRIEDAIEASQGALEMGVVVGAGRAYSLAGVDLDEGVVQTALYEPEKQILSNAGMMIEDTIKIMNVSTGELEDVDNTKIVDPLKVAITAFESALSVAMVAITTEVLIFNVKKYD